MPLRPPGQPMSEPPLPAAPNEKEQAMVGLNHALLNAFHHMYLGKKRQLPPGLQRLETPGAPPAEMPSGYPTGVMLPGGGHHGVNPGLPGEPIQSGQPIAPNFPVGKFPTDHGGIAGFNLPAQEPTGFPAGKFPTDHGGIAGFNLPQRTPGPFGNKMGRRIETAGLLPLIAQRLMSRRG